jgi:hypothetical protein
LGGRDVAGSGKSKNVKMRLSKVRLSWWQTDKEKTLMKPERMTGKCEKEDVEWWARMPGLL